MNRRIANKKLSQHWFFEVNQYAVGHLSKKPNSAQKEAALVVKAIHTLKLRINFPDSHEYVFEVLNPEKMKFVHPYLRKATINYITCDQEIKLKNI